jgi:hypothetical protein
MEIIKKLENLDALALAHGVYNFTTNNKEFKELAEKRFLEKCISCIHFKEEPIIAFRKIDTEIPELSNMQCGDCGCVLSFKLRQSKKICKLW